MPGSRRNLRSQGHFQEDCLGWQRTGLFPIAEDNGNHSSSRSSWIRYLSFCKLNVDLLLKFLFSDIANLKIKIRSALLPTETFRISPWKKCKIVNMITPSCFITCDKNMLRANNCHKWKNSRFFAWPCHKVYGVKAVGLSLSNYNVKITIFCE